MEAATTIVLWYNSYLFQRNFHGRTFQQTVTKVLNFQLTLVPLKSTWYLIKNIKLALLILLVHFLFPASAKQVSELSHSLGCLQCVMTLGVLEWLQSNAHLCESKTHWGHWDLLSSNYAYDQTVILENCCKKIHFVFMH